MTVISWIGTVFSQAKASCSRRGCLRWAGTGAALLLSAGAARAAYHLWDVNEVYSSADGTVQFIELRAILGGQQSLGTFSATIRSTNSSGINVFTFPTNLPGDTASKTCILGTSNLASVP